MLRRKLFILGILGVLSFTTLVPLLPAPGYGESTSSWGDMSVKEGSHFTIRYQGGENAVAGYVIAILLEEAYLSVGGDFDFFLDEQLEAFLFSKERFRDITRSPAWAGAIFDGTIKLPVGGITDKTKLLENVLFHEYTHAVVFRLSRGKAPVWLNEGIAQYEEGKRQKESRRILRNIFAEKRKIPLRALEGSFMGMDQRSAAIAYLVSLSATEYLVREYGVGAVKNILIELGTGSSLDDAFQSVIYTSYNDFEEEWYRSLWRFLGV